jgi:hypothetical protein
MIRYLVLFIALAHGLIHLMGFFKAFGLAKLDELKLDISRPSGLIWLAAAVLFGVAGLLFAARRENWWMWALPAIALSQTLIVLAWSDARFGTITNVILLLVAVVAWSDARFRRMALEEVAALLPSAAGAAETVGQQPGFDALPAPVQRWLQYTGAADRPAVRRAHLRQTGRMRTSPGGKWMTVEAEQWFNTADPAFVWLARVHAAPGLHLSGRDKFGNGRGHMLIKVLSLFPVVDAKGDEIDQGSLLRYMGELVWWPSAAVHDYFRWEEIDDNSARLHMNIGSVEAQGTFVFDEQGRVLRFEALRYYSDKDGARLEPWVVEVDPAHYRNLGGMRIPARAAVTWKLPEGEFNWFNLEISEIDYQ